jgi:hypothetical protein
MTKIFTLALLAALLLATTGCNKTVREARATSTPAVAAE